MVKSIDILAMPEISSAHVSIHMHRATDGV